MKKRILLISLVLVLIGSIAGGVAYAVEHKTMVGDKLVGTGIMLGEGGEGAVGFGMFPVFQITNPDCAYSITIKSVALLDSDGAVLWEGPPGEWPYGEIPGVLGPHEIVTVFPFSFEGEPPEFDEDIEGITLEVEWGSNRKGLPLAGVVYEMAISLIGIDGMDLVTFSPASHSMVNYKQQSAYGNGGNGGSYTIVNGPYYPLK